MELLYCQHPYSLIALVNSTYVTIEIHMGEIAHIIARKMQLICKLTLTLLLLPHSITNYISWLTLNLKTKFIEHAILLEVEVFQQSI
jgi:hypothetical protein